MTPVSSGFRFHGITVRVISACAALHGRLQEDFGYFHEKTDKLGPEQELTIEASLGEIPRGRIPSGSRGRRTRNAVIHHDRKSGIRLNDYYGSALACVHSGGKRVEIFSNDLNRLHEVVYLCILSRVGKALDLRGAHRIHAMGVVSDNTALLFSMPMKGGKTTLFLNMLQDPDLEILSDDSPLITRDLKVLPFPLRVGFDDATAARLEGRPGIDLTATYEINRMKYGRKTLLPISAIKNRIYGGGKTERIVLVSGKRRGSRQPFLSRSIFFSARTLFEAFFIGWGLPIMREYFVEDTGRDWFRLVGIALSRAVTALKLMAHAELWVLELGTDHDQNVRAARSLLAGKSAATPSRTAPTPNPTP